MTIEIMAARAHRIFCKISRRDFIDSDIMYLASIMHSHNSDDEFICDQFIKIMDMYFDDETTQKIFDYLNGDIKDVREIERLF